MAQVEEDYEIVPKQEVENLKKELERLKRNPLGNTQEGKDLLEAVSALNNNIKRLIDIFANADAQLASDYGQISPVEDIKAIKDQNEQIAQGLVTVADMMKDLKEAQGDLKREMSQPPAVQPPQNNFGYPPANSQPFASVPSFPAVPQEPARFTGQNLQEFPAMPQVPPQSSTFFDQQGMSPPPFSPPTRKGLFRK